jgi:hypothetical protein
MTLRDKNTKNGKCRLQFTAFEKCATIFLIVFPKWQQICLIPDTKNVLHHNTKPVPNVCISLETTSKPVKTQRFPADDKSVL